MIIVLKLTTGEEIIGNIACENDEQLAKLEYLELCDPMWIVGSGTGAMKLRDALMLSSDAALVFSVDCIVTCYKPSSGLIKYYNKAVDFNVKYANNYINQQIEEAANELGLMAEEEEKYIMQAHKKSGSRLN